MYYVSVEQGQMLTGILEEKGVWGLWMFWPSLLGSAVVPLVIAPLWSKLDFITDNQFILFRFAGKSARFLHQFRSIYVGGIVVPFLISFHILAFSNVLQSYFSISHTMAVWLTGIILLLFALKNAYDVKMRTDAFHALLYFFSLVIAFYFLYQVSGGWDTSVQRFQMDDVTRTHLLPPKNQPQEWSLFFVFLGMQWWSAQLFDGGGPEMSRFTAIKGRFNVIKTAIFPVVLYLLLSVVVLMMVVMALSLKSSQAHEKGFIDSILIVVPSDWKPLILVGFFAMFITTTESLMNWGGSFLSIDLYKTYLAPGKSKWNMTFISFSSMILLSFIALLIALNNSSLKYLILIVFSISAGVAPVYILRWFWVRINAWTQLSAMIASCFFTLVGEFLKIKFPHLIESKFLDAYSIQFILVTLLTSIVWIVVTFLTDSEMTTDFKKFHSTNITTKKIIKEFSLALLIGIVLLLLNLVIVNCLFTNW